MSQITPDKEISTNTNDPGKYRNHIVGFTMPIGINVISWASINNNFLNPGGEEYMKLKVPSYQSGVHFYTLSLVRLGNSKGLHQR